MKRFLALALVACTCVALSSCAFLDGLLNPPNDDDGYSRPSSEIAFEVRNENVPVFSQEELTAEPYEYYSDLDSLGRCGVVKGTLGVETMPALDEKRGSISSVKPSGWVQAKYDTSIVQGGYLWNRSHLIGWQLSAENANKRNLITGTRYFNVEGMLPFENMVADHIREKGCHVAYKVTPDFKGENLVCHGVTMEAYCIECQGNLQFNVYCFNIQPGIEINYATGESRLAS
ncbi:MAG: DNA/RNA non-specific endonuclease [Clostridia bacterium]|nr:DNA/RNA non-specific endonuclease [Clostridia bacterium]